MTISEKIEKRTLPPYTKAEETANTVTHIVGGVLGILILIACIFKAISDEIYLGIVGGAIFGCTMILLYTISSLYHGLKPCVGKKIMQTIDHCTIYFFIAGTYTPILICGIARVHKTAAITILVIEWCIALIATAFNVIDLNRFSKLSMVFYIAMGWCIIVIIEYAVDAMGTAGFLWLLSGGIVYTLGAVLYGIGKRRNAAYHTVFHIFTVIGSVLQAFCILFYVL